MTRTVPKFKLEFDPDFIASFQEGCRHILESDTLQEGAYVRGFEEAFARFIGARYCVATSSGTTALEVALRSVCANDFQQGVKGREVIVPTNTFIATSIAVERAGGILTLLDIESDTFALCPELLEKAISERTGAVVLVHIGGVISKYVDDIVEICAKHGVPLVEDAAHAHGASRGKWRAGSIGQTAAFSFFPTKVMTCAEGGMVVTCPTWTVARRATSIKNFGRLGIDSPLCNIDGLNAKMTEFQGLLGVMDLKRAHERIARRTVLASWYRECLGMQATMASVDSSHYKFILRTKQENDALRAFCSARGVSLAGEVYRYPLHEQPIYAGRFDPGLFPVANGFCRHHICPPLYPEMEVEDVRYVCEVLREAEKAL